MIKAVIFDCFGVLAEDGWLPLKREYIGSNKKLEQEVSDLGKQNEYGMVDNSDYLRKTARLLSIEENKLKNALSRRVPNEQLLSFIESKLKQRYKIGLLSNANFNVITEIFTDDQASLFDASVMSYESKLIKPDPRSFRLIAERLDAELSECIFVDDVDRYCLAAEDLGMKAIIYQNPEQAIRDIELALGEY